jgi:two-component system, LytTR family, response regulator
MKALIVEDEPLARRELHLLLESHPEITVVGEAISPKQAVAMITELGPDLLFLDVNLRGGTGFDLLDACGEKKPMVIFITAHPDFAVQAFDFAAADYLVKPIRPERLALSIRRILDPEASAASSLPGDRLSRLDRIFLKDQDQSRYISLSEIRLIESEGNYSRIHFGKEALVIHRSLSSIEERLPTDLFFRANRAQILNLEAIVSIEPWFSNSLRATLSDGTIVEFSRRASLSFRETREL